MYAKGLAIPTGFLVELGSEDQEKMEDQKDESNLAGSPKRSFPTPFMDVHLLVHFLENPMIP